MSALLNRLYFTLTMLLLVFSNIVAQENDIKLRKINVDLQNVKGKHSKMFNFCIGAGRANEGLRADWQEQLRIVQKEIGFRYIRMHGLLHDDMGIYKEDNNGNPIYNFQYVDKLYDYLLSVKIKPFVELSFMPSGLASDTNYVFWWKGNITPPKSYEKWSNMITALVEHLTARYGKDEVKTWYFEVWNEPNLHFFFTGTMIEYFKLYKYTAEAIKGVCKDYRVGGPATAGNGWVNETIEYCKSNNVPLDFIATHDYGVVQGFFDDSGNRGTILDPDTNSIVGAVKETRRKIRESDLPNLELHYTEWSSSYTPTDYYHDTYQQSPYILDKIKKLEGDVTSMSYWVFTDIFEEAGPRFTPFHGGFGMINYQSIKKPAYYAYKFMSQLGDLELKNSDSKSWICKDNEEGIQILLWNFTYDHPGDSTNNQIYYKQELPSKLIEKVELSIPNLPQGKYIYKVFRTGYRNNDAYSTYLNLGSPKQLSKQQELFIKEKSDGNAISNELIQVDGGFYNTYQLKSNDVVLIKLKKI